MSLNDLEESQQHKYKLVEAEVVNNGNAIDNNGKKQRFNGSNYYRQFDQKRQDLQKTRRQQGNRRDRYGNNRKNYEYYDQYISSQYPDMYTQNDFFANDPRVTEYYTQVAVQQIENYFSTDNLCRDIFLRQHMDVEGFVPIAFVCNFPLVACYNAPYMRIIEELRKSLLLEIDEVNETVRLRSNWEVWLLPNHQGGFGVPRYIKVIEAQNETQEIDDFSGEHSENNEQNSFQGKQFGDRFRKRNVYSRQQPRRYSRKKLTQNVNPGQIINNGTIENTTEVTDVSGVLCEVTTLKVENIECCQSEINTTSNNNDKDINEIQEKIQNLKIGTEIEAKEKNEQKQETNSNNKKKKNKKKKE